MSRERIMIMAGGTGGHVYPALAVANYLQKHDVDILWLGTDRGLENRVVPGNGYRLTTIKVSGLRGKGLRRLLGAPVELCTALFQSIRAIRAFQPQAVLGMGGYVSGPGGLATWLLRIPLYIHEQNAIAGLTNRLLSPFARKIMQGFPGTFKNSERVHTTGNPVREEIVTGGRNKRTADRHKPDELRLLVLGGSLGARTLNSVVPSTIDKLAADTRFQIWHQTGVPHLQQTVQSYEDCGNSSARVEAYIDDMASAYAWADLVLCRAGALTLAELCISGLGAILVPFPFAVDDHQTANASVLSNAGAAILIPEAELQADSLASLLSRLFHVRTEIQAMAESSRAFAYVDATEQVAGICMGEAGA